MRLAGILNVTFLALIGTTACNRNEHALAAAQPLMMSKEQRAAEAHGTLSREHTATITVPAADLAERFRRLSERCTSDAADHCTILQSDVSTGPFASGLMRLLN